MKTKTPKGNLCERAEECPLFSPNCIPCNDNGFYGARAANCTLYRYKVKKAKSKPRMAVKKKLRPSGGKQ